MANRKHEISHLRALEVVKATYANLLGGFDDGTGWDDDTVDAGSIIAEEGATPNEIPSFSIRAFALAAAFSVRFRSFRSRFRSFSSTSSTETFVATFSSVALPSTARTNPSGTIATFRLSPSSPSPSEVFNLLSIIS